MRSVGFGARFKAWVLVKRARIGHAKAMQKTIILYAGVLALAAFALQWMEYQYFVHTFTTEIYIVLLVLAFMALGIWLGRQLTPQRRGFEFELNDAALVSLNITKREHRVLEELAAGLSNKQIADLLHVSPNTIKSHIARLYEKLDVGQRVQAVQKAKDLRLIP